LILTGFKIKLVDLPGTYSLTAYSMEELVARDYIVNEKPNVIINIIDASNIERNLYLLIQLNGIGISYNSWFTYDGCCKKKKYFY